MKAVLVAFVLMLLPFIANAQGSQTEIMQRPVNARHLDGYIRMRDAQGISGVRVDEYDEGWKHVLTTTIIDRNGQFHLDSTIKRSTHYLRLTALGFNLRFYTIRLSERGPAQLELELNLGT